LHIACSYCTVPEVAHGQKLASGSPSKPSSRGSPSGVVIKSLAEIKREKISKMQQHAAATDETQSKTSEPVQRNERDSKIMHYTSRGTACHRGFANGGSFTGAFVIFWCHFHAML